MSVYTADNLDQTKFLKFTVQPPKQTFRPSTHPSTPEKYNYFRKLIIPEGMQPRHPTVMTFPLYGVHVPPTTKTFCLIGFPIQFKEALMTALKTAFVDGEDELPVNFGDSEFDSDRLFLTGAMRTRC